MLYQIGRLDKAFYRLKPRFTEDSLFAVATGKFTAPHCAALLSISVGAFGDDKTRGVKRVAGAFRKAVERVGKKRGTTAGGADDTACNLFTAVLEPDRELPPTVRAVLDRPEVRAAAAELQAVLDRAKAALATIPRERDGHDRVGKSARRTARVRVPKR